MTKASHTLNAEVRTVLGRKVKNLRKQGIVPATVYGKGFESTSIQIASKDLDRVFDQAGESSLVELILDGKTLPVLFRNPQYHPVDGGLIHVDCFKVNLKEKITTFVPINLIGEAPAVKAGNVLVSVSEEIEVEALPADLPESFEVDISTLENLDSVITVADLKTDAKVKILSPADHIIVKLEEPRAEEVEPVAEEAVAPGEVPATAQKTPEEIAAQEAEEKKEKE